MSPPVVSFQTGCVPIASIPASLPHAVISPGTNLEDVGQHAIQQLARNGPASSSPETQWRDIIAMTGNIRTFRGGENINRTWSKLAAIQLNPGSASITRNGPIAWVEAMFDFEIPKRDQQLQLTCSGIIRIAPNADGNWQIVLLVTMLEQLQGYGNVDVQERISVERSAKDRADNGPDSGKDFFECAIVGGGQAGLITAGRLKALGVSHVVLDRNADIGGNWLTRYRSFTLHTSKTASEMPFGGVHPAEAPWALSSAHLAAGYERFVQCGGQEPNIPNFANRDNFSGELLHSVDWQSGQRWKGKRGIVVGSANSAHDVALDMVDAGLSSVTLIQRSPTELLPISTYKAIFDPIYYEGCNLDLADKLSLSIPLNITRARALVGVRQLADAIPEYWEAIDKTGFVVDRYPDLINVVYERQGGHYFDVGGVEKIISGEIKTKLGAIESFTKTGLRLENGQTLNADVIVLATGFKKSMRQAALDIVDAETAERMEEYWMFDKEGELRGYAKPMVGQPNAWYIGAALPLMRYFSRYLALQIKTDLEGATFQPYRDD